MWLLTSMIIIWAISPGPVTIITLQNTRKHDRMAGIMVAFGATLTAALVTVTALFIENLGLRNVIGSSKWFFFEQLGAWGIVLMGLLAGYKTLLPVPQKNQTTTQHTRAKRSFMQGMVTSAAYIPQALVFFTIIVPQTIKAESAIGAILFLGSLRVCLNLIFHSLIAIVATRALKWVRNNRFEKWLELSAAVLMVGIGINGLLGL